MKPDTGPKPQSATTPPSSSTQTFTSQVAPTIAAPAVGQPIGFMTIPRLGMTNDAIVEGAGEAQLQEGPGHYTGTSLPGEAGNVAIAGHRTTYAHPFYNLNLMQPGDFIYITTTQGLFDYEVTSGPTVVPPTDVAVLDASTTPELTLTTCNPRYSATSAPRRGGGSCRRLSPLPASVRHRRQPPRRQRNRTVPCQRRSQGTAVSAAWAPQTRWSSACCGVH